MIPTISSLGIRIFHHGRSAGRLVNAVLFDDGIPPRFFPRVSPGKSTLLPRGSVLAQKEASICAPQLRRSWSIVHPLVILLGVRHSVPIGIRLPPRQSLRSSPLFLLSLLQPCH